MRKVEEREECDTVDTEKDNTTLIRDAAAHETSVNKSTSSTSTTQQSTIRTLWSRIVCHNQQSSSSLPSSVSSSNSSLSSLRRTAFSIKRINSQYGTFRKVMISILRKVELKSLTLITVEQTAPIIFQARQHVWRLESGSNAGVDQVWRPGDT